MKKNAHRINPLRLNQFLKVLLMFKFILYPGPRLLIAGVFKGIWSD
jgi:hypothetical protein